MAYINSQSSVKIGFVTINTTCRILFNLALPAFRSHPQVFSYWGGISPDFSKERDWTKEIEVKSQSLTCPSHTPLIDTSPISLPGTPDLQTQELHATDLFAWCVGHRLFAHPKMLFR